MSPSPATPTAPRATADPVILRRVIDNWRHVPLSLRQQYWRETDYGARLPTFELLVEMERAVDEKHA